MSYKFLLLTLLGFSSVLANEVKIVDVKAKCSTSNVCTFSVALKHADSGWEHYAYKWSVHLEDGKLLGTRILHHPHVNEQPFTRSLSGVKIPASVKKVYIKAYDSVHKESKDVFEVVLK